jgi:ABC-2 type transport system permease protein
MRAIRESATGGSPWPDIAMCLVLGGIYVGIGVVITESVLSAARKTASLSLT